MDRGYTRTIIRNRPAPDGTAHIDRVTQVRNDLEEIRYSGQLRAEVPYRYPDTTALEWLDFFDARDFEGHSQLEHIFDFHTLHHIAAGLLEFMYGTFNEAHNTYATFMACYHAAVAKQMDYQAREQAIRLHNRGLEEVHCLKCRRCIYSDYHTYICGEEDTISFTDYMTLLATTDDQDDLLGWNLG